MPAHRTEGALGALRDRAPPRRVPHDEKREVRLSADLAALFDALERGYFFAASRASFSR
jgi:hypothetical protein